MKTITSTLLTAGLLLAPAPLALAQDPAGSNDLVTATHAQHGDYLADGRMRALYMFEADTRGTGDTAATTACTDDCAAAWPPLTVEGDPQVGPEVDPALVGTIERPDGSMQVTYNGWPLYYFVRDEQPGDVEGQDVEGFGAEWYLVAPSGEPIHD